MIGIIAPCSVVPKVELALGVQKIKEQGLKVRVHPQCKKSDWYFAGSDADRAEAFFEYAQNPELSVLWAARGGYGAIRLLPYLDEMTQRLGVPARKLLVGYSDLTVLMEYVRHRWGWATLHAPLPSMRRFSVLPDQDWQWMVQMIQGNLDLTQTLPWSARPLKQDPLTLLFEEPIVAEMVGGNLTVWTSALGTPYAGQCAGKILFLEDVDESIYRLDRMLQQLRLSGSLAGVRAIVLGNFLNCNDSVNPVLKRAPSARATARVLLSPQPKELKPLRRSVKSSVAIQNIFAELSRQLRVPVLFGLPVGHGPGVSPLPLGATYRLSLDGRLQLIDWTWL